MAKVLIIDDNETMREGMAVTVKRMGHEVLCAASGAEGVAAFERTPVDFVITDLKMEGQGGLDVLSAVRAHDPDCPTMIVTAYGSVETAVEAVRLGAFDFLQKPFAPDVLRLKVTRALEVRKDRHERDRARGEAEALRADAQERFGLGDMVGGSPVIQKVFSLIDRVAPSDIAVHIHGESGTGKELVARALHERSARAQKPFIKVNCGALAETLLESELFGHEKGAFTGSVKRKLGRFELADGGTLFLDEVGDMSPALQVKLLRVLQEKSFERVGGEETLSVDVRTISATHRDLKELVSQGQFREDLFYRMHVVACEVPPLRERPGDIALLAEHFVKKLAPKLNPEVQGLAADAVALLEAHAWPGNVRELENVIEQSLVFAEGSSIGTTALPAFLQPSEGAPSLPIPQGEMSLPEVLEDLERQLIERAYRNSGGVKTETARQLGIKTSALYYKLEKYGIGDIAGRNETADESS